MGHMGLATSLEYKHHALVYRAQAVDLWAKLFLIALMFATGVLGVTCVVIAFWSHRSKQLDELQAAQFRQRMAQITIRRRLA
jgi:uncharacterized membrane protein YedE/YeeE